MNWQANYATKLFSMMDDPLDIAVISGDSLVLRGRPGPQGQPPKERQAQLKYPMTPVLISSRVLHLADVSAPRLGTSTREDEVRDCSYHGFC